MNKEELLKAIMELPKAETNNHISAMNGINVSDLMSAVDRLNKIPDYNDLLKENQELEKRLEEINKVIEKCGFVNIEQVMLNYCGLLTQQKEFINYLEDKIDICDCFLDTVKSDLENTPYRVMSSIKKYITTLIKENEIGYKVYEEILQKYKSIIGVLDEESNNISS